MPETRSRKHEGVYFVVVDGVPRHCQWQELKDYLRDFAKVRPGHTNVIKLNEDGTRVGYCPLPNKTEAYRAFDYLVAEGWQGLDIRVSVIWKSDLHSQDIQRKRGPEASRRRRLQSNVSPLMRLQSGAHHVGPSPSQLAYSIDLLTQSLQNVPVPMTDIYNDQQCYPVTSGQISPQMSIRQGYPAYQYYSDSASQTYDPRTSPQNLMNPSIITHESNQTHYKDRQSIHISKLRHDIKSPQLKQMLARYGQVSEVTIKRGKEKRCSATAKYENSKEALLAIQQLNGKVVDGLELVVRHDRSEDGSIASSQNATSSSSDSDGSRLDKGQANSHAHAPEKHHERSSERKTHTGPLVVNGARGTSHYRKRGYIYDDDSESAADSSNELGNSNGHGHDHIQSTRLWGPYRKQIETQ